MMTHDTTRRLRGRFHPERRDGPPPGAEGAELGAFVHAPTPLAVADLDGVLTAANPSLQRLLGRSAGELLDVTLARLAVEADRAGLGEQVGAARGSAAPTGHQVRLVGAGGRTLDTLVTVVRVDGAAGAHLMVHVQDVTDYTRLVDQMRERALHDPLTGLANRTLLLDRLEHAFASHRREGWPVSLLFLDLDDFKAVNDVHGHGAGDQLLVHVGARLLSCARSGDTVARMGGDEFAVLCERTSAEAAARVAERLQLALRAPVRVDGTVLSVHASVGVQTTRAVLDTPSDLLRRADAAMYETKRSAKVLRSA